jgi:hypothetical protein
VNERPRRRAVVTWEVVVFSCHRCTREHAPGRTRGNHGAMAFGSYPSRANPMLAHTPCRSAGDLSTFPHHRVTHVTECLTGFHPFTNAHAGLCSLLLPQKSGITARSSVDNDD